MWCPALVCTLDDSTDHGIFFTGSSSRATKHFLVPACRDYKPAGSSRIVMSLGLGPSHVKLVPNSNGKHRKLKRKLP